MRVVIADREIKLLKEEHNILNKLNDKLHKTGNITKKDLHIIKILENNIQYADELIKRAAILLSKPLNKKSAEEVAKEMREVYLDLYDICKQFKDELITKKIKESELINNVNKVLRELGIHHDRIMLVIKKERDKYDMPMVR